MTQQKSIHLQPKRSAFTMVELIAVVVLLVVIVAFLLPTTHRSYGGSNRVKCAANLKQIGNALILYSNENKGLFPRTQSVSGAPLHLTNDGFADVNPFALPPAGNKINNIPQAMFLLIRQEDLTPSVFICPTSSAVADTMAGQAATLRSNFTGDGKPGGEVTCNVSYSFMNVYPTTTAIGLGYKTFLTAFSSDFATAADISPAAIDSPIWATIKVGVPRNVIVTGNSKNHGLDGQNVLYADGHAEFQQTPLCGSDNDNIYTPQNTTAVPHDGVTTGGADPDPRSATDSVLLIHSP